MCCRHVGPWWAAVAVLPANRYIISGRSWISVATALEHLTDAAIQPPPPLNPLAREAWRQAQLAHVFGFAPWTMRCRKPSCAAVLSRLRLISSLVTLVYRARNASILSEKRFHTCGFCEQVGCVYQAEEFQLQRRQVSRKCIHRGTEIIGTRASQAACRRMVHNPASR